MSRALRIPTPARAYSPEAEAVRNREIELIVNEKWSRYDVIVLLTELGLAGGAIWGGITGTLSDQTDLNSVLAGKAASSHTHAQSDITNLVSDLAGKASTSHTHAAADITSGTIDTARLGSGTPSATTYLRGDQTWATLPAGGDVVGPGSSVDNTIPRFDSTTGKIIQASYASVTDEGSVVTLINSGACEAYLPATCWVMLTADYTLTNSGSEQKAFNTTTNGALTLPTGVYEFECFLYLTTMSGTSGNLAFDPVGAGTAVTDRWGQHAVGIDSSTPLSAGTQTGSGSVTQQTPASAVTAGAGTGFIATFSGMFRISTGGTIIPSVTLVTAAAAVVKAGSWFRIRKVGESSATYVGAWT